MLRYQALLVLASAALALTACATTAQMHTQEQLNTIATGCGLALGELIQDQAEKKLLIALRSNASAEQRICVKKWARRNGLKPVFVDLKFPES